jgi:phosphonate transport system substrate-binding protein
MKRISYFLIALFVIAGLALAGCAPREAELGTEENPIIWALVPSGETDTVLTGFQSVADIIFEQTGLVIEPFVATEYAGVIEAMSADPPKAHMASLATFAYMLASERGAAEAELVSLRRGSASYNGQIFVRTDSGITSVADLAGKTFCGVDPLSTSGWIIPSITLAAYGVNPDTDLAGVVYAGSHDAAVSAVYNGECDAGSSFVDARSNLTEDYPDIMEEITVIEVSVDIPNDGVQYHPSVSREIRDQINGVLLTIHETEAGAEAIDQAYEWSELALRDDTFYEPFRQILDAAGVDISQFLN